MKKEFFLVVVLFLLFVNSVQVKEQVYRKLPKLVNTKWVYVLDEDCVNYLAFKENNIYIEYNCELGECWEGNYKVVNDTLILKEKVYSSNVEGKGRFRINIYKLVLFNKGLSIIYSKTFHDGKWIEKKIDNPKIFYNQKIIAS